jgi:hypothetical protein
LRPSRHGRAFAAKFDDVLQSILGDDVQIDGVVQDAAGTFLAVGSVTAGTVLGVEGFEVGYVGGSDFVFAGFTRGIAGGEKEEGGGT